MTDLVFIEEAPMQGLERPASPGVTIGRAECDVDLNDPDVSRRHAVVRRVDEGLAIEDLGSTQRHVRQRSPHRGDRRDRRGDRIRFGNTVWRLGPSSGAEGDEGRSTAGDAAGSGLAG